MQEKYLNRLVRDDEKQMMKEYRKQRIQVIECLKQKKYYRDDIYQKLDKAEVELGKFDAINDANRLENYVQNSMAESIYKNAAELE